MIEDCEDLPPLFREWLRDVDCIMKRDWYIDTADAGVELERLLDFWRAGWSAEYYVSWFAEKYGLYDFG